MERRRRLAAVCAVQTALVLDDDGAEIIALHDAGAACEILAVHGENTTNRGGSQGRLWFQPRNEAH